MKYNIPEESFKLIIETIENFTDIDEAILFGSRAKGNNKRGSDIDISIKGEKISYNDVLRLSAILNQELPLPYFFDIVDYTCIKNEALRNHIDRVGKVIYKR